VTVQTPPRLVNKSGSRGSESRTTATLRRMGELMIPSPLADGGKLTPRQSAYVAAILRLGPTAKQVDAAEAAGCAVSTIRTWRCRSEAFRRAELAAMQAAFYESAPHALNAVQRLLSADVEHGHRGVAEAGRMARWYAERTGIVAASPQGQPVTATLRVEAVVAAPVVAAAPAVSAPAGEALDVDWYESGDGPAGD
jgi:hypothetical protein